ncbi:hypothetical protein LEMA_P030670.1 [Plenodomus lingam JN3]|uniref:Uncharacterized protein n=1 Tax=Leptosphaeria maculans (strain JN3 / isolate v23.1.3 / race Av1-4-5-6-7-8) TaxID=985895 RepID=E4ZWD9_LEPMJ|nr:hypothetical protein LEMA_P030670.1 [Plenodomus lingam JN3]CBX95915.1 hypothetical protein LEMA_P030670.1 [Plenodomus lingam JN3]
MLLSLCAEQLKIPYLASGGFANGRQVAAALALGASGVNMGTRWMCTVESPIHHKVKEAIVNATENDTVLCLRKFRNTSRLHKNKVSLEVVKIENEKKDVEFKDVAHLMSGKRGQGVYETGDVDAGVWSLGMCAGLIHDIPTCEDLVKTMERDVIDVLAKTNALIYCIHILIIGDFKTYRYPLAHLGLHDSNFAAKIVCPGQIDNGRIAADARLQCTFVRRWAET